MSKGPVIGLTSAFTNFMLSPKEVAQWAEANGFDSIWIGEHTHVPTGQKSLRPDYKETPTAYRELYDPLLTLMNIADATTTLKLCTSILILPEHHPIRLAKMIATLDQLSGGRVILGIGAGWSAEEMADYGIEFKDRWKFARECVLAMREIWNNEIAEFSGEMIKFDPMWCGPKPVQPGGPRVLMGGWNKFALPRAAAYCDGWLPVDQGERMAGYVSSLREECDRVGRSFDDLDLTVLIDPLAAFSTSGSVEKRIEELHAMGFNRMLLYFMQEPAEVQWESLDRLGKIAQAFQ